MILQEIQSELKAPKGQFNKFGGYKYRSCEDILEAVKPILSVKGCALTLCDDVQLIGGRVYVKATATLKTAEGDISCSAFAREAETKKGMDEAQITGAASSYARKYALGGLFALDDADSKDPDTQEPPQAKEPAKTAGRAALPISSEHLLEIIKANTEEELLKVCGKIKTELGDKLPYFRTDLLAHYKRRSETIKQEIAGV